MSQTFESAYKRLQEIHQEISTQDIIDIDKYNYGDKLKIGSVEFVCVEGSGLTDNNKCKYLKLLNKYRKV